MKKIIYTIGLLAFILLSGCNNNETCYNCIRVECIEEDGMVRSQSCILYEDVAEETYNEWLQDDSCLNVTIDYDFLQGEQLCYDEEGILKTGRVN